MKYNGFRSYWVVFAACLLSFPGRACAEKAIVLTDEVQLKIADAFMEEKEYYRAITEYKKILILFPDWDKAAYVRFRIGAAYFNGEEYESAARTFSMVRYNSGEEGYAAEAAYFEALSYWKLSRLAEARLAFQELVKKHPQSDYAPLALAGSSLVALEKEDITASREDLMRLVKVYPDYPGSRQARDASTMLDTYNELPRKSQVLAGIMSAVLPGSGHVYAGRYNDGITALLISGLAIAGVVTGIQQENYAVAGIVAGVGVPFYLGNIYGAANAAKKWNIAIRNEFRQKFKMTLGVEF